MGYLTYYRKQDIIMKIGGQKRKMVYVMNEAARPGHPSYSYVNTIWKGVLHRYGFLGCGSGI